MKNKLEKLFAEKKKDILSIYFTAGYPEKNSTIRVLKELQECGTDLVEIGIPYSDPLADGPTIQKAGQKAIQNGMTLELLFEQLQNSKSEIQIPIILMGYLNTIVQFGIENFYKGCSQSGVSGIIIPDLPIEEYELEHKIYSQKFNIHTIFLITPKTSIERIQLIDEHSSPFIYVVSSNSITGKSVDSFSKLERFYKNLETIKNKTMIGFGIKDHQSFTKACKLANGAIIGSAFIHALSKDQNINDFINNITHSKIEQL